MVSLYANGTQDISKVLRTTDTKYTNNYLANKSVHYYYYLKMRLFSPAQLFIILLLIAGVTLFYVSNVVRVNQLLGEIKTLEYSRDSLISSTNLLRNEVFSLESSDRINRIARENLGLTQPAAAPIVIERKRK